MPSTIGKCKLFKIKHITLLEGEPFLRNKHKIAFFFKKCTFFFCYKSYLQKKKKEKAKDSKQSKHTSIVVFVSESYFLNKAQIFLIEKFFTKKKKVKSKDSKQSKHTSIVVFVCKSYLFCDSFKYCFMESQSQQHHAYC